MQNQVAAQGIRDILKETVDRHGWCIPLPVFDYTVSILAEKVSQVPFTPEPSYAERYMMIKTPSEALAFGNTCFFTRGVFPDLMTNRGLNSDYFVSLGQGSYTMVLKHSQLPHVKVLRDHFEFLAEVVYTAVRLNGEFRSMWL